jgi:hypothetical protein
MNIMIFCPCTLTCSLISQNRSYSHNCKNTLCLKPSILANLRLYHIKIMSEDNQSITENSEGLATIAASSVMSSEASHGTFRAGCLRTGSFFKNLPVPNYQSLTAEVHPLPPNSVRQLMYRRSTTHNKDSAPLLSSPN